MRPENAQDPSAQGVSGGAVGRDGSPASVVPAGTTPQAKRGSEASAQLADRGAGVDSDTGCSNSRLSSAKVAAFDLFGDSPHIDRLTAIVNLAPCDVEAFARYVAHSMEWGDPQIAKIPKYRRSWQLHCGLHVDYGDSASGLKVGDGARLRLDWNPAKCDLHAVEGLSRFLSGHWRWTRIDFAIDYLADLSRALFLSDRATSSILWGVRGLTQTIYLGSHDSPLRFRCYDKRQERLDKEPKDDLLVELNGSPLFRVEAQWRPGGSDELIPDDLFDSLSIWTFPPDLTFDSYATLKALRADPSLLHLCGAQRTRERWRARLRAEVLPLCPAPSEVYRANLGKLRADVFMLMMLARGGVELDASEVTEEAANPERDTDREEDQLWNQEVEV